MEIFAYLASALIGVSLGLIGGGGSVMTMPVLVYLFGTSPLLATSYSLFIVGSTSLVGALNNYRKGQVSVKTALLFGLTSITTVFLTRRLLIPVIPKHIVQIGAFELTQPVLTMVAFAALMVASATAMIRGGSRTQPYDDFADRKINVPKLLAYGIGVGLATGMLGVGGGFLLIPALVLLVGLPMKEAIGTSLLIIALNSLIGFTGDIGHFVINWLFLLKITSFAVTGIFVGGFLNQRIDGVKLKKGFGWFILFMGVCIIAKELLFKQ